MPLLPLLPLLHSLVAAATRQLVLRGPAAGRYAIRWAPYYLAKYTLMRTVKHYGVPRLYRRAVEATRRTVSDGQREPFLHALKGAIRAPSAGYAKLIEFDKLLWQWILRMERDAADGHGRATSPEMRLLAASTKLLLLSRGSKAPVAISSGSDSKDATKR